MVHLFKTFSIFLWTWNRGPGLDHDGPHLRFLDRNQEASLNVSVQVHIHFIWKVYDSMSNEIHSLYPDQIIEDPD